MTGLAAILRRKNVKNYNLLVANWKILNIFITKMVFGVKKSISDIRFYARRPRDRVCCHFVVRKYENTKLYL